MKSVLAQPKQGKLVVVVGPTASGKSDLAMELAQEYQGEIVCADSRTVYKGFDIGTAKPGPGDQALVPHHLLDVCDPGDDFSVSKFKGMAQQAIEDIWSRGKVAFLVGGSGMYVDAVIYDYQFRDSSTVETEGDYSRYSIEELRSLVAERYPTEFSRLETSNKQRLEHILERGLADSADRSHLKYDCIIIGLNPNRLYLKQNIEHRIDVMLSNGFVQEVEGLIARYGHDCPQLNIIGYRHTRDFIDGVIGLDEVKVRFAHDDMALAKRQMTWFKRNPAINWLGSEQSAGGLVDVYLSKKV